jgi:hypothetical protein
MIDIVTVVFQEEIEILRIQAQSIDLYCQPNLVRNIRVIVNDSAEIAEQIDPAWWGKFQDRVHIIPRDQYSAHWVDDGWVSQQALKIAGSAESCSGWAMVMDAKTVLTRPVDKTLWDAQGRLRSGSLEIYSVFYPARDIVNQLFDIDLTTQLGPGGVPFFFKTDIVRSMITEIQYRTGESFIPWFQAQGRLTEFILYSGYVAACKSQVYNQQDNAIVPVNVCHSETGIFDIKLEQMNNSNPLTVGIHRRAWNTITSEQQQQYRDFLIRRGLTWAADLS